MRAITHEQLDAALLAAIEGTDRGFARDAARLHVRHFLLRLLVTLALVVLHDEADLRLVGVEQRVGDLHRHKLVAALLGHPAGGQHHAVVVAVAAVAGATYIPCSAATERACTAAAGGMDVQNGRPARWS